MTGGGLTVTRCLGLAWGTSSISNGAVELALGTQVSRGNYPETDGDLAAPE